jgi:N-acetylglucosaminyl-diphospho-decaprenol L-rhamnosyltransferase
MNLLIAIINYRTPQITLDCLASLAPQIDDIPGGAHVMLVDNASGDDSIPMLTAAIQKNGWSRWIDIIPSKRNLGFAGGNNLALDSLLDYPEANYVLLLNSDTILKPNVLKHCYDRMEGDETIGVMSCMLLNPDDSVQNTARKLPTPLRLTAYSLGLPWRFPRSFFWADLEDMSWDRRTQARDVDWVGGAFMFVRRRLIDKVGGLDTRFFFYGEDAEYCRRAWKNRYRVFYDPAVAVVHLGGASSDPSRVDSAERDAMRWQARYLLQRRCYGIGAEIFVRAVDICSFSLRYLKLWLRGQRDTPEFATQRDVLAMLLRWPAAAAKR